MSKYTAVTCKAACNERRHCIGYYFAELPDKTCNILGASVADFVGDGWRKTTGLGTAPIAGVTKSATATTCFRKPIGTTGVSLVYGTAICTGFARFGTWIRWLDGTVVPIVRAC